MKGRGSKSQTLKPVVMLAMSTGTSVRTTNPVQAALNCTVKKGVLLLWLFWVDGFMGRSLLVQVNDELVVAETLFCAKLFQ